MALGRDHQRRQLPGYPRRSQPLLYDVGLKSTIIPVFGIVSHFRNRILGKAPGVNLQESVESPSDPFASLGSLRNPYSPPLSR